MCEYVIRAGFIRVFRTYLKKKKENRKFKRRKNESDDKRNGRDRIYMQSLKKSRDDSRAEILSTNWNFAR